MGKIQCIGSLRCSRRPGPESAERKQRKKQIFRQGWLVLLLKKKSLEKSILIVFASSEFTTQTNGLLAYAKKQLGPLSLAKAEVRNNTSSVRTVRMEVVKHLAVVPATKEVPSHRHLPVTRVHVSPMVWPCRQMASKSTSSMTLCLHKLGGGVVWYLVCWDANKNVDFKERSARLQRLNLSFELKKIVAQRYCQRHFLL